MKTFLKKTFKSDLFFLIMGHIIWFVIFIVQCVYTWKNDVVSGRDFVKFVLLLVIMFIQFSTLKLWSYKKDTFKITNKLDILAKELLASNADDGALNEYKKLLDSESLEKWEKQNVWKPCIFKPCSGQLKSHECVDGFYNSTRKIFKVDPKFVGNKIYENNIWLEDNVLEYTLKDAEVLVNGKNRIF